MKVKTAAQVNSVAPLAETAAEMPWFRRSHKTKKKQRISKKDISEPTGFKHCYHAADIDKEDISELSPSWYTLVGYEPAEAPAETRGLAEPPSEPLPRPDTKRSSSSNETAAPEFVEEESTDIHRYTNGQGLLSMEEEQKVVNDGDDADEEEESSPVLVVGFGSTGYLQANHSSNTGNKRAATRHGRSSSKSSIESSISAPITLTKRPSPATRGKGSDTSLEDTIRLIRKQCQSRSNDSFQEEEPLPSHHRAAGTYHQRQVRPATATESSSHGRFHRPGSFMQLRTSPVNRKQVVSSYITSSSSNMASSQGSTCWNERDYHLQHHHRYPHNRQHHLYHHNHPASSSALFSLSAPSDVVQSDLSLYNVTNVMTAAEMMNMESTQHHHHQHHQQLQHGHYGNHIHHSGNSSNITSTRIGSPISDQSQSSGYFGSNGSSLYSSKMSSMHHIPNNAPLAYSSCSSHSSSKTLSAQDETDVPEVEQLSCPQSAPYFQHQHHQYQQCPPQKFYSLQRQRHCNSSSSPNSSTTTMAGQFSSSHDRHITAGPPGYVFGGGGGGTFRGGVSSHYGTAPRSRKQQQQQQGGGIHHTTSRGSGGSFSNRSTPTSELEGGHYFRIQEGGGEGEASIRMTTPPDLHRAASQTPSYKKMTAPPAVMPKKTSSSRMTFEQFRATLELLVNPANPRREYVDFVKIGEGSTGLVYRARDMRTNSVVAVKKMNLWKQQRRELLFNEVSHDSFSVVI